MIGADEARGFIMGGDGKGDAAMALAARAGPIKGGIMGKLSHPAIFGDG